MKNQKDLATSIEGVEPWVGMDVGKHEFAAALYVFPVPGNPDMQSMPAKVFENNSEGVKKCVEWVESLLAARRLDAPDPRVCMESTGQFSRNLAEEILDQRPSWSPAVVNARYIKKYGESLGQRCKSDKPDARVCAGFGAERRPEPFVRVSRKEQELRELTRERKALVNQQTALKNRMSNNCKSTFVTRSRKRDLKHLEKLIDNMDKEIQKTMSAIPEMAADGKAVMQIPGVGTNVSSVALSELGDLRVYSRGRRLSANVGINPKVVESGMHKGKTRMSKQGNARVRHVLFLAAMACLRTREDHSLKRCYRRLIDRGMPKKKALGVLMRKILLLMRSLVISGEPYDPDYDLKQAEKHKQVKAGTCA